ncbi:hypothetical protein [Variovorax sp. JS1663]|uniref:hypothetical protein n=1 Tax=Variovorax sp. JS1663 TaxID=1851577 RepID=UPI000513D5DE|nr:MULTISPECIES: hypothetical protein [Burkholderiales]KGF78070.1 hypothetical protein IA69_32690 [Massilia sp. JS1662]OUM04452.1 hypothetical protein A8M77_01735 [Variovorax sp. JS1663]
MATWTITEATPEEVRSGDLGRRLRHFNCTFVGEYPESQPIWLNAKDEEGRTEFGLIDNHTQGFYLAYMMKTL